MNGESQAGGGREGWLGWLRLALEVFGPAAFLAWALPTLLILGFAGDEEAGISALWAASLGLGWGSLLGLVVAASLLLANGVARALRARAAAEQRAGEKAIADALVNSDLRWVSVRRFEAEGEVSEVAPAPEQAPGASRVGPRERPFSVGVALAYGLLGAVGIGALAIGSLSAGAGALDSYSWGAAAELPCTEISAEERGWVRLGAVVYDPDLVIIRSGTGIFSDAPYAELAVSAAADEPACAVLVTADPERVSRLQRASALRDAEALREVFADPEGAVRVRVESADAVREEDRGWGLAPEVPFLTPDARLPWAMSLAWLLPAGALLVGALVFQLVRGARAGRVW